MLPAASRLRRSREFTEVVSGGVRAGGATLVVHLDRGGAPGACPTAGFIVSKAVGPSVVRHAVVRRLRAVVGPELSTLPEGSRMVVRALPLAASVPSRGLARDLARALARASAKLTRADGVVAGAAR